MAKKATPVDPTSPFAQDTARVQKITKRLLGEKETKSSSLPFADAGQGDRITQADEIRAAITDLEKELKVLKDGLIADIVGLELPGLRTATTGFMVNVRSRQSLNKDKLLTKISASELAECYEDGPEYYEGRFQEIK